MKKDSQQLLDYLRIVMSGLNLMIIFFISSVSIYTVSQIKMSFQARRFMDAISYLPLQPERSFRITLISYFALLIMIEIRSNHKRSELLSILLGVIEVILCILILYSQSVAYTGILFLVTADIVRSLKEEKYLWIFFGVMSVIYIFADYHFLFSGLKMIAFEEYLFFMDSQTKFAILGIKNILSSLNIILFILYMIVYMRKQKEENEYILYLNHELKIANEKLNNMNRQLQDYADMQYQLGEVTERNRIAREIHDTLGHTMTGLTVGIEACIRLVDLSREACIKQLRVLADVSRDGLKDVRRSVNKLRPDMLEKENLDFVIRKMIYEMENLHHIRIAYTMSDNCICQRDYEETIYRIVQESITNAIRHGKAENISIVIQKEEQWFVIRIQDDGIGCININKGFGLIHMKERLDMISGELSIDGSNGFTLIAKIPVRIGEKND